VLNSEFLVLAETLKRFSHSVVRRQNLDYEKRRVQHDPVRLTKRAQHDEDVGNAIAGFFNASPAFRTDGDPKLLFVPGQVNDEDLLQSAMSRGSHISLHKNAIHVLHVGAVAGIEILVHRHQG
jgi:hypothetical protein